jgi:hypothetical protein
MGRNGIAPRVSVVRSAQLHKLIRDRNYDEAVRVVQRGLVIPKNARISYHDQSLPVQSRLFKSLKLWSFYVDLEESIGTVETTRAVYDKILELRIANAQVRSTTVRSCRDLTFFRLL